MIPVIVFSRAHFVADIEMENLGYPFFIQRTRSAPAEFFHLEKLDLAERGQGLSPVSENKEEAQKQKAEANRERLRTLHEAGNQF